MISVWIGHHLQPLIDWDHVVDPCNTNWFRIVRRELQDMNPQLPDFCPKVKELLRHIDRAVKWTLGEIPPLETCRSDNGRVILIGDAWRAMLPHSASGGNSAVEDAVSLAECLEWAWQQNQTKSVDLHTAIAQATQAFEDIRKPRVERMQIASHEGYMFLSAGGEEAIQRNKMLAAAKQFYDAELALPEETRLSRQPIPADMNSRMGTEPYFQWLYRYDAVGETRRHLLSAKLPVANNTKGPAWMACYQNEHNTVAVSNES